MYNKIRGLKARVSRHGAINVMNAISCIHVVQQKNADAQQH